MCTSKATPVSRSRGWCSMRTIVSMKVTLIRRRTADTDEMRDMQQLISTDLSHHLCLCVCVCVFTTGFFNLRNIPINTTECTLLLQGNFDNCMLTLSLLYKVETHTALTHLSQWFVQTSQAPPAGQEAPRTPPGGPSGTPEPAACWRSCLMTSLGSPNPHLSAKKKKHMGLNNFCTIAEDSRSSLLLPLTLFYLCSLCALTETQCE